MRKHEEKESHAWLALWARLATTAAADDAAPAKTRIEMARVIAAAGQLRHHQTGPANDGDAAALISLLFALVLYVNSCANARILLSRMRKSTHAPGRAEIAPVPSIHAASALLAARAGLCQNEHLPTRSR